MYKSRRQMVERLSHITFIVRDLDQMEQLLTTVLDARKIYDSGDRTFSLSKERFFLVGGQAGDPDAPAAVWIVAMEGDPLAERSYNHIAFKIKETDYDDCLARARSLGREVRDNRPRGGGE